MNQKNSIWVGPILMVAALAFLIPLLLPLPGGVIDFCIVISFAISLTVYLRAATIKDWSQFKTFPTVILLTAVFRISLNVATTKKILTDGKPGDVIEQFGHYVIGANTVIGFVVFAIIIVIQFIIANGAGRLSEVSARFTLDALPGKQMSIDADLNAGAINQEEAKKRRTELDQQIDFFGHMDGAGKFVKGDVWLSLIVVFVNVIGGLVVGMLTLNMSFTQALSHFTILTIGDGIVNQCCSFLITVGSAIIMTRVYDGKDKSVMGGIMDELVHNPMINYVVGGLLGFFAILGLFTDLPILPFLVMSLTLIFVAYTTQNNEKERVLFEEQQTRQQIEQERQKVTTEVSHVTEVDPITLEVGFALIPVVNTDKDGVNIKDKIVLMRRNIAQELGVKVPKIRIADNASLTPYTKYNIKIKDSVVATGELKTNSLLAFKTHYVMKEIEGIPTLDPIFKEEAIWITEDKANEAKELGYKVLDPLSILSTHLSEMIQFHIHELLERQEVYDMIQEVGQKHKILLDEINKPERNIDLALIQGVLKNLLRENISIRDLPTILEAIIDGCKIFDKVDDVTMIVREKLAKQLSEKCTNFDGKIHMLALPQEIELNAETMLRHNGYYMKLNGLEEIALVKGIKKQIQRAMMADLNLVILTGRNDLRCAMARLMHKYNLPITVMNKVEVSENAIVERFAIIELEQEAS